MIKYIMRQTYPSNALEPGTFAHPGCVNLSNSNLYTENINTAFKALEYWSEQFPSYRFKIQEYNGE